MPKSKEFVESSDSASDGESRAKATSNKSKTKGSNSKNDVSSFRKILLSSYLILLLFVLAAS
jgi:hypothetical protein